MMKKIDCYECCRSMTVLEALVFGDEKCPGCNCRGLALETLKEIEGGE